MVLAADQEPILLLRGGQEHPAKAITAGRVQQALHTDQVVAVALLLRAHLVRQVVMVAPVRHHQFLGLPLLMQAVAVAVVGLAQTLRARVVPEAAATDRLTVPGQQALRIEAVVEVEAEPAETAQAERAVPVL